MTQVFKTFSKFCHFQLQPVGLVKAFSQFTMADVKSFVDNKIANKKVMIFSKQGCPYCTKAKQVLSKYVDGTIISADQYEVLEIDGLSNCSDIQDYLLQLTGGRSVPRVFINHIFVGGGDDVAAKDKSGQLLILLKS